MVEKKSKMRSIIPVFVLFIFNNSICFAIDNPDSINLIQIFKDKASTYLNLIDNPKNTNKDLIRAYHNYHVFLDNELNNAYQTLTKHLPFNQKKELIESQRKWLKYRDSEIIFINNNWNRKQFGSSAINSRGDYQSKIIENRIIQLLFYAQNY